MEHKSENRICQNCKNDFIIELEDFNFYEKIKVPPPTFCPWCRLIRRFSWRNERALYKRDCNLCEKNIISMHPSDVPFPVYCRDCWYSDKWDATIFGRDYDFSKTFFEQFNELMNTVPRLALWQRNSINSEYSNMAAEAKNVYLSVSITDGSENVFYSKTVDASFNIFDSYNVKDSEECYQNIEGVKNYNSQYLILSRNCIDSYFLIDCANCSNCFMCSNLRNKQYYIRNIRYLKEEYQKEIEKFNFGSRKIKEILLNEFNILRKNTIYRFSNIIQSYNSSGNNLINVKNCKNCFDGYEVENLKYCYRAFTSKDCMDFDFGQKSELLYEYITGAMNDFNVKFSCSAMGNIRDSEYTDYCVSAANLFGCAGIKNKNYSILNKTYSKEEFIKLREKIIKHMNEMPYIDKKGRIYKYGEFFPSEISPFAYNETLAQEFFPLSKEGAILEGYRWKETELRSHNVSVISEDIPDEIRDVDEKILDQVFGCNHGAKCNHLCSFAFRITPGELQFYKKHDIPIPNKCPNCRYYERFNFLSLPKLYHRKCTNNDCSNEFETSYAPNRPEKVYCESCYNKEVY